MGVITEEYRATADGLRYGFAVGKVRALATRLLGRADFERLVDAPGITEQRRILSETPYGRFLESAQTPEQVESGLDAALDSAYSFLDEAGLPEAVVRFFRLRFDFANLKAALKARALGIGLEGLLVSHGSVPLSAFGGHLAKLPAPLGRTAVETMAADEADGDARLVMLDASVDRAMFAELRSAAVAARSPFLGQLAALLVDLANLKTFVRAQRAGMPADDVEARLLIAGGGVPVGELVRLYRLPAHEARVGLERRMKLKGAPLSGESEADLDVIVDDALQAAVRAGRRPEPGADAVIAYVLAREAEAQVLRVALLGKMSGLDSATLHRRLRASFR